MDTLERCYLELLARLYPTPTQAAAEITKLQAILNLPKGTEFFVSDIHGEYEAFSHILRNASGSIRDKIDEAFGEELSDKDKSELATLIYYPREKLDLIVSQVDDLPAWYRETLPRLVVVSRHVARKYTRARVRRLLSPDFAYLIEDLMSEDLQFADKQTYYQSIGDTLIDTGCADDFVCALGQLIQRLAIDHLHVVGDVYDRGPYPHVIMDMLQQYHSLDIQWGNHDIVWMGASLGQRGCIAHVVRNCARYGNLSILEDAYGINILPLATFAMSAYRDDPCVAFGLKGSPQLSEPEIEMNVKIQKAMAIIQFKVEGKLIDENPSFGLDDRKLLHLIDYERGTIVLDGVEHELTDKVFPTVDPSDPYRLTPEEEEVMNRLEQAFVGCEKLQRHMRFFLEAGSLYKTYNNNLMFHACVPLNEDGSLMEVEVFGEIYKGRALYEVMERYVRAAFSSTDERERRRGTDLMWYLWLGPGSPLFAKSKMATFELYLIADKAARKEHKNSFYSLLDNESVLDGVFQDFGLDPKVSRIVCGHVPVKVKDGEDPVKCGGKVLTIDGGFSRAYQPTTGIAGYTLISNSYGFVLAAHEPLESIQAAVTQEIDIHSSKRVVEEVSKRTLIGDTDKGVELRDQICGLKRLLEMYQKEGL